jgi:hypothetical protein
MDTAQLTALGGRNFAERITKGLSPGRLGTGCHMPEKCNDDRKLSLEYLDLAYECFTEAAMAEGAEAAEQFRRMGHRYIFQAAIFGVALSIVEATRSPGCPPSLWSEGPAHRQK